MWLNPIFTARSMGLRRSSGLVPMKNALARASSDTIWPISSISLGSYMGNLNMNGNRLPLQNRTFLIALSKSWSYATPNSTARSIFSGSRPVSLAPSARAVRRTFLSFSGSTRVVKNPSAYLPAIFATFGPNPATYSGTSVSGLV